ncbi:MAG: transposase [Caldilineaceae bacterium]|nr:transposase [Caldilineaceae bacterium]
MITQSLRDLDAAFKNFFAGRAKYPHFKRKHHAQSVRYQLDQRHIAKTFDAEAERLKLPKLGALKLRWSRPVEGIPKMVTIRRDSVGRYFVSLACEVDIQPLPALGNSIGIDVGVKDVVAASDGFKSGAPKYTRQYARRLKLAQRRLSRQKKGSKRYQKQRQRIARIHARIADSRRDFTHQLSTQLIRENQAISTQTLNIKGMLRNGRLSKSIADSGLHELHRQLKYKAQWYGRDFFEVDQWERTTGVCPDCATVGPKLKLRVRQWRCECGRVHDRDIASAQIINLLGTAGSAGMKARGAGYPPKAAA